MNTSIKNLNGKYFKEYKEKLWLLLFYHDVEMGGFFSDFNEARQCYTYEEGKYSLLYLLNNMYRINNKYEFLLEYPKKNLSNHWRQTKNPLKQMRGPRYALGYEEIDVQMNSSEWGGLFNIKSLKTLLSGSYDWRWHYAIGVVSNEYVGCIPGPGTNDKIVYLWLMMPTELKRCMLTNQLTYHSRLISLLWLIIVSSR